jgi:hypothetical protein
VSREGVTLSFRPIGGIDYEVGVLGLSDRAWHKTVVGIEETQVAEGAMTTRVLALPPAEACTTRGPWLCRPFEYVRAPRLELAQLREQFRVCARLGVFDVLSHPGSDLGLVRVGQVRELRNVAHEDHVLFEDAVGTEHTLRCVFPALHVWRWGRMRRDPQGPAPHDRDIIGYLNEMESYFAIARTEPRSSADWVITGIWGARRTLTTDLRPARRLQERDLEPAGTRICWRCGRVTEAYVDRASNRHTFRCGHCGYPIGRSASY